MSFQTKIIVPIRPSSLAIAKRQIRAILKTYDLVEVWLDRLPKLAEAQIRALEKIAPGRLIFNLKGKAEQGDFRGSPLERVRLLAAVQASFVDLPLDFPFLRQFRSLTQARLILSWHDFKAMPSLSVWRKKVQQAEKKPAAIIKLVGSARRLADNLIVLRLAAELEKKGRSFIVLAMGERGVISRVVAPFFGAFGMFAPLRKANQTAPGQLTAAELRKWWGVFFARE